MVPVLSSQRKPLMPCTEKRARRLIEKKQAFPFWNKGVFCIRLLKSTDEKMQRIAVGVDPGSKRESYSVSTGKKVILNVLTDTPVWVKKSVKIRREMRKARRFRNTPYRKPKWNNLRGKEHLPPSTRSRWQAKLRILNWLSLMLPITDVIFEDIVSISKKGQRRWNLSFFPLQFGKSWFNSEIESKWTLHTVRGFDTAKRREIRKFNKNKNKLGDSWDSHNVDSHCLVEILFDKEIEPFKGLLRISFLQLNRRQLHRFQPSKGGLRNRYGSTRSLGLKRGSYVVNSKYGLCYVGGNMDNRISIHFVDDGGRITQCARVENCVFLTYSTWRYKYIHSN